VITETTERRIEALRLLSEIELDCYRTEGYLVRRKVFRADEMSALAADVDRALRAHGALTDANNMRVRFRPHHLTGEPVFETFDPISDLSPLARRVADDPRILDCLHDLYGEAAELFKDKLIYKPPGAQGTALHQDWIAWSGFPQSFLTVVVAIDPFTPENGATEVFPRVHRRGYLSAKDGQHHNFDVDRLSTRPVPLYLETGDVAIFGCFTPHRSGANTTGLTRRGYFISYNARSDGGQQYARHYREFHNWIRARASEDKKAQLFFR
jgi:hypothetical protein